MVLEFFIVLVVSQEKQCVGGGFRSDVLQRFGRVILGCIKSNDYF